MVAAMDGVIRKGDRYFWTTDDAVVIAIEVLRISVTGRWADIRCTTPQRVWVKRQQTPFPPAFWKLHTRERHGDSAPGQSSAAEKIVGRSPFGSEHRPRRGRS